MGVLNVTPDSFYDGGRYPSDNTLQERISEMVAEGVDLIDVGGESTRPGSQSVSVEEELDRVIPAIKAIVAISDVPVSIDTTKAKVAAEATLAGAGFINDISGLQFDPDMAKVVATSEAGLFLMHTRGRPDTMQSDTSYRDIMSEIAEFLGSAIAQARAAGVAEDKIAVDPGIGFGKSVEGNLEILRRLEELNSLGRPILLGTSRKSFIGKILQQENPEERLAGSLATIALGVAAGARIFRVHDVQAAREAAEIAWAITGNTEQIKSGT
jgi:dihydropteroate synthase